MAATATTAFFQAQTKKLDPSGTRRKFLQKTRKGGRDVKVEKLAEVYDRKACKKCNCESYNAKKQAIAATIAGPAQQEKFQILVPAIERMNALFGGSR